MTFTANGITKYVRQTTYSVQFIISSVLTVGNESINIVPGKLFRIPLRSLMSIRNEFPGRLVFLVFKTPHPDAMKD